MENAPPDLAQLTRARQLGTRASAQEKAHQPGALVLASGALLADLKLQVSIL